MSIDCTFTMAQCYGTNMHYTCKVTNKQINEDVDLLYIGQHEKGNSYADVTAVWFLDCKITRIPQKLTQIFPNLKAICIENSNLKSLNKGDLAEYKDITCFYSNTNPIEYLPRDLFDDLKELQKIYFVMNNLTFIEPNILDGLDKLEIVNFSANPNYDKCFSANSGVNLQDVKNDLFEKFQARFNYGQAPNLPNLPYDNQDLLKDLKDEKTKNAELKFTLERGIFADLKKLTENENFNDFKVVIEDQEFYVHKFLLAARSPILADMLLNNREITEANFTGISTKSFDLIVKFFYTDELPRDNETDYEDLFVHASRLGVKELRNHAAVKIFDQINAENALQILNLSNSYKHNGLREKAFEEIKKNFPNIEFDDEWAEDGEKVLNSIEACSAGEVLLQNACGGINKMKI